MEKQVQTIKRYIKKKRAIFLIVLLLFVLVFTLFRNSFLGFGLEVFLNSKFKTQKGVKFHFEKMAFQSKGIIFSNLEAYSEEMPHVKMAIDCLKVGMRFNWRDFEIDPIIDIDHPMITLSGPLQNEKAMTSPPLEFFRAITRHIQLNINRGELILKDDASHPPLPVYFSYKSNFENECFGILSLAKSFEELSSPMIEISISSLSSELFSYFDFNKVEMQLLAELNRTFSLFHVDHWTATSGIITGNTLLHFGSKGALKRGDVQLELENIGLSNQKTQSEIKIDSANWRSSFPLARNKERVIHKSWADVAIKSSVKGFYFKLDQHSEINLYGKFSMNLPENEGIDLKGHLDIDGLQSQIAIKGDPYYGEFKHPQLGIKLSIKNDTDGLSSIDCHLEHIQSDHFRFTGVCHQVDVDHLNLIQKMITPHFPDVGKIDLKEGKLECEIVAEIEKKQFKALHLEKIIAHNLHAHIDGGKVIAFCSKLEGALDIDLKTRQFDRWKMIIESGDVVISDPDRESIMIYDLSAAMASELDTFSHSYVHGRLFDHIFDINFYGQRRNPDLDLIVKTSTEALLKHFPRAKQASPPPDAMHTIHAHFSREMDYWRVRGEIGEEDPLSFGFKLTDFSLFSSIPEQLNQLSHRVFAGWFKGHAVDEAIYHWILYFLDVDWAIRGQIDTMGRFDGMHVKCELSSHELDFISDAIDVRVRDKESKAFHGQLDFTYDHRVLDLMIPIEQAECSIKKFDLDFSNLSGDLYIRDDKLFIHSLKGESYGLKMGGQVDLNFYEKQPSHFEVHVDQIEGPLEGLKQIAQHFPDFASLSTDINGQTHAMGEGFVLISDIYPVEKEPVWNLKIHVDQGVCQLTQNLSIADFSANVECQSKNNATFLQQIQGVLCVDRQKLPYMLSASYFNLNQENEGDVAFDFQIEDEMMSLLHLLGKCRVKEGEYHIHIDPKESNYLGSTLEFTDFKTDLSFNPLSGNFQFDLEGKDLPIFSQMLTQFNVLPKTHFLNSQYVKCNDFLQIDLEFDEKAHQSKLDIQCREASIATIYSRPLHLILEKTGDVIDIKRAAFGEIHFDGQMHLIEKKLIFDPSVLHYLNTKLPIHGGELDFTSGKLDLDLKEATINLDEIKIAHFLAPLLSQLSYSDFSGNLNLNGHFTLGQGGIDAELKVDSSQFGESQLSLTSETLSQWHFDFEEGLLIRNLDFNIAYPDLPHHFAGFCIGSIQWNEGKLGAEAVEMTVSPAMIDYIIEKKAFYPINTYLEKLQSQMPSYPWDHLIQVKMDLNWDGPHFIISGILKEGTYALNQMMWEFKQPKFRYQNQKVEINFQTHIGDLEFDVQGEVDLLATHKMSVNLKRLDLGNPTEDYVAIEGSFSNDFEVRCERLEGKLFGAQFDFASRYPHFISSEMILGGSAILDPMKIVPFLPHPINKKIRELAIQHPLVIEGDIMIDKNQIADSYFKGYLKGRDLIVNQYILRNLIADILINRSAFKMMDFRLSDQAGLIVIDECIATPENKALSFEFKGIQVSEFRPSLLRKIGEGPTKAKPFVMRKLKIDELKGNTADLNSIKGKGYLKFHNTFKTEHNTRLIPLELITRLGLDLGLLVPVRGEIDFQIEDQKIKLMALRDSYSEGKRSHFFFPSTNRCYIKFDGEMNVDVKMKQYVLFKITQPFMISLRGSVMKPKYGLK
ncbi:MAG: hypothetical protein K9M07_04345 [Simkaniaceae bacterium]|nr:hypothetical protein [Simkaniaceae bacterium]